MATLTATRNALRDALRADPIVLQYGLKIPKTVKLLGNSVKIEKGEKKGILTAVLYLSPATESGIVNTCPWATAECAAACLGHSSGQMVFDTSKNARVWRTIAYKRHSALFTELLSAEIAAHEKRAQKLDKRCAVRLDGTSDLGLARRFATLHKGVQFYDYTKSVRRALETVHGVDNWHVTFSFSGHNLDEALTVLKMGGNVAVAFRTKDSAELPETWEGFPVLDADETDARFDDPAGHVAGLTFKGAKLDEAGAFAQPV